MLWKMDLKEGKASLEATVISQKEMKSTVHRAAAGQTQTLRKPRVDVYMTPSNEPHLP